MHKHNDGRQGFTIVELLIVVVVIAILAAISIVAYTGIQARAETAKIQSDFRGIQQAIELYRGEFGQYPDCPIAIPSNGCNIALIEPLLSVDGLPTQNPNGSALDYVRGYGSPSNDERWAIRFRKSDGTSCKVGKNPVSSWWTSAPACW